MRVCVCVLCKLLVNINNNYLSCVGIIYHYKSSDIMTTKIADDLSGAKKLFLRSCLVSILYNGMPVEPV